MEASVYTCTLCDATIAKAKEELGEDPETRGQAILSLRTRIESIPGLKPCTDAVFLLRFLRARKFNEDRAVELIKSYYEARKNGVEFFNGLKPTAIKHVIDSGVVDVLKEPDAAGCRVVVMRAGRWDPDVFPMIDVSRAMFLVLSRLLKDEETQVHGVHIINDLGDTSWRHARHISPSSAKYFMKLLQDVLPLRMKRLDYVREPTFFDVIFAIIKQFMKEKLTKRIGLHGENMKSLHEGMNPDHLPTDLGGNENPFANKEWMDEFLGSDIAVEQEACYGLTDEPPEATGGKDIEQSESTGILGIPGFFKKLNA